MNRGRLLQRRIANSAFSVGCYVVTAIALAFLAAILWSLISQGIGGLGMGIALLVGVLAGTWLAEFAGDSHFGAVVRFFNDVLLSAPSILIGLFVYGLLVRPFHGYSGYAGSVALALLAVPVITRTTEDVMRLQPSHLRESAVALGAPLWKAILSVLWRSSKAGIITGALLAFARITGETAPLLFTALNNQFFSLNMAKPTASLPVVIFQFALSAYDDWRNLAWAGALLIAIAVLAITIIARLITREPRRS
jgi:phosphate transport system permease protein